MEMSSIDKLIEFLKSAKIDYTIKYFTKEDITSIKYRTLTHYFGSQGEYIN